MQTILAILKMAGGWHPVLHLHIDNPPIFPPSIYRDDYLGIEQWSRDVVDGTYIHLIALHAQHESFAKTWDSNLRLQGFAEAFERRQTSRA